MGLLTSDEQAALVAQQHDSALAAISSTAHKQADGHECPTERDTQSQTRTYVSNT